MSKESLRTVRAVMLNRLQDKTSEESGGGSNENCKIEAGQATPSSLIAHRRIRVPEKETRIPRGITLLQSGRVNTVLRHSRR